MKVMTVVHIENIKQLFYWLRYQELLPYYEKKIV